MLGGQSLKLDRIDLHLLFSFHIVELLDVLWLKDIKYIQDFVKEAPDLGSLTLGSLASQSIRR